MGNEWGRCVLEFDLTWLDLDLNLVPHDSLAVAYVDDLVMIVCMATNIHGLVRALHLHFVIQKRHVR